MKNKRYDTLFLHNPDILRDLVNRAYTAGREDMLDEMHALQEAILQLQEENKDETS